MVLSPEVYYNFSEISYQYRSSNNDAFAYDFTRSFFYYTCSTTYSTIFVS